MVRKLMCGLIRRSLIAGLLTALVVSEPAVAQVEDTKGVTRVFSLTGGIAAYDESREAIRFFTRKGGTLVENGQSKSIKNSVWGITEVPQGLLVATGMGRKSLTADTAVTLFPRSGSAPINVFRRSGERSQVPFLRYVDGKVWITYFESKYTTKTGYLAPSLSAPWKFTEVATFRLGDVTDVKGGSLVIGRPYGDLPGQDGDITLINGGARTLLPSFRGVRAATFIGSDEEPQIVIGDGWHQNYGALAQGRVSLIRPDPKSGSYALQPLDNDREQYGFSKFLEVRLSGKTHIVALGNGSIVMYGPEPGWKRTVIHRIVSRDTVADIALVGQEKEGAWVAIVDGGLTLVRVGLKAGS